jgi:hypothetical protein
MLVPRTTQFHVVVVAAVMVVLAATTIPGLRSHANPQHFDMARSLLRGSVWIEKPTATHDLGQVGGRWYSPFPPLPAVVAAVALAVSPEPDLLYNSLILIAALGAVALAWGIGRRLGGPVAGAWSALALGLGSGLWVATVIHDTYHSAHVLAVLGVLGAIRTVIGPRRRWWLAGALLGLAALARQPVILGAPFLAFLPTRDAGNGRRRAVATLLLAAALPFSAYLALNAARFGTPFATGYGTIHAAPRIEHDVAAHGTFSLSYLPRNLRTMLVAVPHFIPRPPFVLPDPAGLSLLIVSPWLVLALVATITPDRPRARPTAWACVLASAAISVPHLLYVNSGWVQFGYRFALDETPFLLVGAVLAVRRRWPRLGWLTVSWSAAAHLWGYVMVITWPLWRGVLPR